MARLEILYIHPTEFELAIFQTINGYAGVNWALDRVANMLIHNNLIKHGLFIASFWVLWLNATSDQIRRRADLCFILVAVSLSLFVNQVISSIFPMRSRPIYWTDIGLREPTFDISHFRRMLETFSSFPSDHAAIYFALTTGFWFISRRLAVAMAIWSVVCLLARIFMGLHFPSDIFIGATIAIVVTVAARREALLRFLRTCVDYLETHAATLFHAAVFLFVFQIGNLFWESRLLAASVVKVVKRIFDLA